MVPDWAWSHVTKLTPYASGKGAGRWKCNYCGKMYGGPPKRIKAHLAKVSGHDIEACSASNIPLHVQNEACQMFVEQIANAPLSLPSVANLQSRHFDGASSSGAGTQSVSQSQPMSASIVSLHIGHEGSFVGRKQMQDGNIEEMLDDARNMNLDDAISKFIFLNAIPFNVVKSPYFHAMIAAACSAGPSAASRILGYKKLRTIQLTRHYTLIKEKVLTPKEKRRLVFGFGSNLDPSFWMLVLKMLFKSSLIMLRIVYRWGTYERRFPFILHNRCMCHVLDLLLEDIGKFDWVSKIVNDCEKIVKFITEKPMLLALFRKFCSRELMKPAKTRFAYIFLMVSQLQHEDVFPCLRRFIVSAEFESSKWYNTKDAKDVRTTIFNDEFWKNASTLLVMVAPILKVLSLADREGATTGLIYEAMYRMIKGLELAAQDGKLDVDKIDAIKCVLVEDQYRRRARWFMMHSSMHSAVHALNPSYLEQNLDAEVRSDWMDYLSLYCCGDTQLEEKLDE
ncbi:uncharacterized protein LOC112342287 [Selaginella moellendorffii]|uniref:uncharacterized protein LOC112342287 n=1 Tax=Selaginella moellendorffii TaxID=88036 RepID=UPI000D1CF38B|nr:uncharacterized protein LOC112342287 [Selaginella moellendorffii]|eukprot:XP_024519629.1 uncharacterized protein LOC112342287 [Selaginella moellendorffii]